MHYEHEGEGHIHHFRRHRRWRDIGAAGRIGIVLAGLCAAAGFFVLGGFVVVWLWNWLMPVIFHLPTIGFWQAWGLIVLSSILFKSHSSVGQHRREHRRKRALREKLHEMDFDEPSASEPRTDGPEPEGTV